MTDHESFRFQWLSEVNNRKFGKNTLSAAICIALNFDIREPVAEDSFLSFVFPYGSKFIWSNSSIGATEVNFHKKVAEAIAPLREAGLLVKLPGRDPFAVYEVLLPKGE